MSFRQLLRAAPTPATASASAIRLFGTPAFATLSGARLFSIQPCLSFTSSSSLDAHWEGRGSRNSTNSRYNRQGSDGFSRSNDRPPRSFNRDGLSDRPRSFDRSGSFNRTRSSGGRSGGNWSGGRPRQRSDVQKDMTPMEAHTPRSLPAFTRFAELSGENGVHPALVENLTNKMKLDTMTDVQQQTIEHTLRGEDVIGQAKTGTGKTLAFLAPLVNTILNELPHLAKPRRSLSRNEYPQIGDTRGLIISPTRELAEQIAAEAERLVAGTSIEVQIAVGGTQKRSALMEMKKRGCHLLVATPGRLKDLLQDSYSGVKLDNLKSLVLDEADRLLDDGFWPEIQEISQSLPDTSVSPRQTLLFSATMTRDVQKLARQMIKPDHASISTLDPNEEPTHQRIPQHLVLTKGYENQMPALLELCSRGLQENPAFKAVVFFNSTAEVSLGARIFRSLGWGSSHPLHPAMMFELHGRLTQAQRTHAADSFRKAKSAVLFASDVAARGMDFPGVTDVVQISAPSQMDTYIHRVGRTGRAGRDGTGWLIAPEIELREMHHLRSMPLKRTDALATATVDMATPAELPQNQASILDLLGKAVRKTDDESRRSVYANLLYRMIPNGRNPVANQGVVDAVNRLARYGWGMPSPPSIRPPSQMSAVFQGLDGVVFATQERRDGHGDRRRGGRDGGRGGDRSRSRDDWMETAWV